MNILLLSPSPLTKLCVGGIERSTEVCARTMLARGHTCVVLAWNAEKDSPPPQESLSDGVEQAIFPNPRNRGGRENSRFFERVLRERAIDVVLFQCGAGWYFPFPQVLREIGVPAVSVIGAVPDSYVRRYRERCSGLRLQWKIFWKRRRQCKKYRFNHDVCARTVVLSDGLIPILNAHLTPRQVRENRVAAIPNIAVFPREEIDFSEKTKELLFVGRMNYSEKRPDRLLRIWRKLAARFPEWRVRFVGDGEYLPELKKLAEQLGGGHVHFEGFRKPEAFYRDAAIFCMTSEYESFGNVLVEAVAFGCVPVAFDAFPSARDIIDDGENGRLVPAFDLDKYAETLAGLMSDDALRERLARNAQAIPEKFSPQKIGERWEKLFKEIAAK